MSKQKTKYTYVTVLHAKAMAQDSLNILTIGLFIQRFIRLAICSGYTLFGVSSNRYYSAYKKSKVKNDSGECVCDNKIWFGVLGYA